MAGDKDAFVEDIRRALYASKIVSYAQGFMLLRQVITQPFTNKQNHFIV